MTGETREMENISRGPTFADFVTILTDAGQHGCQTTEYNSTDYPLPPLFKGTVS
jgi:hypothetical protein